MHFLPRWLLALGARLVLVATVVAAVTSCGSGSGNDEGNAAIASVSAGSSPFIAFVAMQVGGAIASLRFRIEPRPGSVSRPVDVTYSGAYLARRGYVSPDDGTVDVPVFGLYANFHNLVDIDLQFQDGSRQSLQVAVDTAPYSDPNGIYDQLKILVPRAPPAMRWILTFST